MDVVVIARSEATRQSRKNLWIATACGLAMTANRGRRFPRIVHCFGTHVLFVKEVQAAREKNSRGPRIFSMRSSSSSKSPALFTKLRFSLLTMSTGAAS